MFIYIVDLQQKFGKNKLLNNYKNRSVGCNSKEYIKAKVIVK